MKIRPALFAFLLPLISHVQAQEITAPNVIIEGGSKANAVWRAPLNRIYKVWVFVPNNASTANVVYRLYPKGKDPVNTACVEIDAFYPCIEIPVNQALNKNKWVQLTLNTNSNPTWEFVGGKGYLTVSSNKLSNTENLGVGGVRFEEVSPYFFNWGRANAGISALKLAVGECLNDTAGVYADCDSIAALNKYGITELPDVDGATGNTVVTLVANKAAIQIAGDSQLAGCTFQWQPTVNTGAGTITWQPKATAAKAPSTSVEECARYVRGATY